MSLNSIHAAWHQDQFQRRQRRGKWTSILFLRAIPPGIIQITEMKCQNTGLREMSRWSGRFEGRGDCKKSRDDEIEEHFPGEKKNQRARQNQEQSALPNFKGVEDTGSHMVDEDPQTDDKNSEKRGSQFVGIGEDRALLALSLQQKVCATVRGAKKVPKDGKNWACSQHTASLPCPEDHWFFYFLEDSNCPKTYRGTLLGVASTVTSVAGDTRVKPNVRESLSFVEYFAKKIDYT